MGLFETNLLWIVGSSASVSVAEFVLVGHIAAGVVALLAGIAAILTTKGGRRHNQAGKLYGITMAVVVLTALPLAVWIDSWFLFAIAVFTGYLIAAGYQIVLRRRAGLQEPTATDYALHGTMLSVGVMMLSVGGYGTLTGGMELGAVLAVFGLIGGLLAVRELGQFRLSVSARTPWVERHITFMGGGYIATVTAAITVNLTMLPPAVRWLGPTLVGVPLISYALRKYRPRFGSSTA